MILASGARRPGLNSRNSPLQVIGLALVAPKDDMVATVTFRMQDNVSRGSLIPHLSPVGRQAHSQECLIPHFTLRRLPGNVSARISHPAVEPRTSIKLVVTASQDIEATPMLCT